MISLYKNAAPWCRATDAFGDGNYDFGELWVGVCVVGLPLSNLLLSASCLEWSLQPVVKGSAGVLGLPYPCLDKLFFWDLSA